MTGTPFSAAEPFYNLRLCGDARKKLRYVENSVENVKNPLTATENAVDNSLQEMLRNNLFQ